MHHAFARPKRNHGFSMTAIASSATLALSLLGADQAAAQSATARFHEYDGAQTADASRMLSARADQVVKVVVVMSESSVAQARSLSPTRTLSSQEHEAVVERVRAQHVTMQPQVEAQGGQVLAHFHGAVNGIKIEVHPSRIQAIAALPGVISVLPVMRHERDNSSSVPYIGAPTVWQGIPGVRGEDVKVAIIDTGIDYTHANFGGPGTPAAYLNAAVHSTLPADPALFGPGALKVKGGIDLVGDAYNANVAGSLPVPDLNPLDCAAAGHGSHVAGTVAGLGVTASGGTYAGPYDAAAYVPGAFNIGPGVAPKADLYAVRVFGCAGSTEMVVEAIDWAINNNMDVINMSLGSAFGVADSADALAAAHAAKAGVIVVASAGNAGPAPYITGSPASGDGVISVAAVDGRPNFAGALISLANGQTITAQDSNGAAPPSGALQTVVLRNSNGTISLGCDPAEYAGTAGKLVITLRGTCARVDRAKFGQAAGAAAVALINNGPGYGIFEGPIPGVTIPFLGIQPSDAPLLAASASAGLVATTLNNADVGLTASFSSGGPRGGDSALKPSVAAPGVSVFSTWAGSGSGAEAMSGTSMAAPHVSGVAALTRQAHPGWTERALAATIAQTADASQVQGYAARVDGAGLVQPLGATSTQTVVAIENDPSSTAISFGFAEFNADFKDSRQLNISNKGSKKATFYISASATGGDPHTVSPNRSTVAIEAGETRSINVTLKVPATTAGDSSTFNDVAGLVTLTPVSADDNNGVALKVPYYLVERARSQLSAELNGDFGPRHPVSTVKLKNAVSAAKAAGADFYAWGLSGTRQGAAPFEVRAVGVQTFPMTSTDNQLVFAVNTFDRFNTAAPAEVDLLIYPAGSSVPNYDVFSYDCGALTTGSYSGQACVGVLNLATNAVKIVSYTYAPTDGSTLLLPIMASDIGLSPSNPRFSYQAMSWNANGAFNGVPGVAKFNAFMPAISNGAWATLKPGAKAAVPVAIDTVEWVQTPALGVMVVDQESNSGATQATLLRVNH